MVVSLPTGAGKTAIFRHLRWSRWSSNRRRWSLPLARAALSRSRSNLLGPSSRQSLCRPVRRHCHNRYVHDVIGEFRARREFPSQRGVKGAVTVLLVVPADEAVDPRLVLVEAFKWLVERRRGLSGVRNRCTRARTSPSPRCRGVRLGGGCVRPGHASRRRRSCRSARLRRRLQSGSHAAASCR